LARASPEALEQSATSLDSHHRGGQRTNQRRGQDSGEHRDLDPLEMSGNRLPSGPAVSGFTSTGSAGMEDAP
jgi:hypothetical protein